MSTQPDRVVTIAKETAVADLEGLDKGTDQLPFHNTDELVMFAEACAGYTEDGFMALHAAALKCGIENATQTPVVEPPR